MFGNENMMPTYRGNKINLAGDPCESDIDPRDIAWALSQQCRFAGHTQAFYSVAEHSVRVSNLCDPEFALIGLLHDATEAYIQDIIRPLRVQLDHVGYRDLERRWAAHIGHVFQVGDGLVDLPPQVMEADLVILATECRDLIRVPKGCTFTMDVEPLPVKIQPVPSKQAYQAFLAKLTELLLDIQMGRIRT